MHTDEESGMEYGRFWRLARAGDQDVESFGELKFVSVRVAGTGETPVSQSGFQQTVLI